MSDDCTRLKVSALGLAVGVVWGLATLLMGLLATYAGIGESFVTAMGELYYGYSVGLGGSLVGALWGLVDGFIGGALIAWFYNLFATTCCCKPKSSDN